MPYLGNVPAEAYTNTVKDSFNGDASTTAFTLSQPSTTNNLRVVVENVIQDPTVAYTVSGTTLTFTSAPPTGTANIYAVHLGPATQTAVPPAEINNATTYTSDLTVQGAFTSQGIDDNANATAITIDSSENVIVGKTSTAIENAGASLLSTGRLIATAENDDVVVLRRNSSDGDLISLRKDGTTIGSIGTDGGNFYIDGGTNISGLHFRGADILPRDNGALDAADTISLGNTGYRFNNLFLAGGVYLGGTGSANKLDDYEEGTWTPSLGNGVTSATYSSQVGIYTKVGNIVIAKYEIALSAVSGTSSSAHINGLPFTINSSVANRSENSILIDNLTTAVSDPLVQANVGVTSAVLIKDNGGTGSHGGLNANWLTSSTKMRGNIVYLTS